MWNNPAQGQGSKRITITNPYSRCQAMHIYVGESLKCECVEEGLSILTT